MVRTFKNPQGGSLGGCFEPGGGGGETHYDSTRRGHAIDYDDLLNQKRRAELQYRNGVDPFVNGPGAGMKGSTSESFLTRVVSDPPSHQHQSLQEDYGLANGLNDLSNVLSRLQNHTSDPDDSMILTSLSYPNSAVTNQQQQQQQQPGYRNSVPVQNGPGQNRQSWSAPQGGDPLGFKGPDSILPKNGPGDGPAYGRARMQAERNRIRQIAMNGSLSDPLENLKSQRPNNPYTNQPIKGQQGQQRAQQQYNPSMYDQQSNKRGGGGSDFNAAVGKDSYLLDLEQQIAETKDRRKRETQDHKDWWENRKEPQFTVKIPTKPHPSQHVEQPTADQRPDPRLGQKSLQEELRVQMELKKQREAEEKAREREEEAKLEKRIQEQQERMRKEFEEEQAKKKAKEQAKLKRQEDMARRQQEIQKEAERQRKEVAERKFQERKAARMRRQEEERGLNNPGDGSSRESTPTPVPGRGTSPPIPALRPSQGGNSSNNSEFESASMGLSSDDDQESAAALNQLSKMREQLDKKQEDLGGLASESGSGIGSGGIGAGSGSQQRRESIWNGLAEI